MGSAFFQNVNTELGFSQGKHYYFEIDTQLAIIKISIDKLPMTASLPCTPKSMW